MSKPPLAVRLCMEAVCILLGEAPAKVKPDPKKPLVQGLDYWPTALRLFSDAHFLSRIRNFKKDKVSEDVIKTIRSNYISRAEFDPEQINATSLAATGLCHWVRAVETYDRISRMIEPKKARLKKAEHMLKENMKALESRRKMLQEITERMQALSDQFSHLSQQKQDLENQILACETKVSRAVRLLNALGGERSRWEENIAELKVESTTYRQTVLVCAAIIAYLANVELEFRRMAISHVLQNCRLSQSFSMRTLLSRTSVLYIEKREKTVETYVIIDYSQKVPMIVDPHGESSRMLPRLHGDRLVTASMTQPEILDVIAAALAAGKVLLIDNVSAPLPLFVMQLFRANLIVSAETNEKNIQLEDRVCRYHDSFRLLLRSDRLDPNFSVEFLKNVCIVNISLGSGVVEENIMDVFLDVMVPELNTKRDELSAERSRCIMQLDQLEEKILDALGKSKDLENERVIEMLGGVRELSAACAARTYELNNIETQLDRHRAQHVDLARYTAQLIHLSISFVELSPYYLRNLRFYFDVFREFCHKAASNVSIRLQAVASDKALFKSPKTDAQRRRVLSAFRRNIAGALFTEHRAIYEFLTRGMVSYADVCRMSDKEFVTSFSRHIEPHDDSDLREIVFAANSRTPLALLLTSHSTYVVRNIYKLAVQLFREPPLNPSDPAHNPNRVQLVPTDAIAAFNWKACLEDDQWICVQNCQLLTLIQLAQLEALIDQIAASELRKANFRMFLILYSENGEARHSLLGKCTVLAVDDAYSLKGWIAYCYTTISPQALHDQLDTPQRKEMLYKLCCFHFVLVERSKYEFFGFTTAFNVTTVHFESAVSLFKVDDELAENVANERSPLQEMCERWKELSFELLCKTVLEVAYLSDAPSNGHDVAVFRVLAQWIFVGLDKYDNHTIEALWLKNYAGNVASILAQLRVVRMTNEAAISGLHDRVIKAYRWHTLLAARETIKSLLTAATSNAEGGASSAPMLNAKLTSKTGDEQIEHSSLLDASAADDEHKTSDGLAAAVARCVENECRALENSQSQQQQQRLKYLRSLHGGTGVVFGRILVRCLERPHAILEQLKQLYAKRHRLGVNEVVCYGVLKAPIGGNADSIQFSGCHMCCARYNSEVNCLQEADRCSEPLDCVWILARRRAALARPDTINVPLMHRAIDSDDRYTPLVDVEVASNLSSNHWLLRGVKICSTEPLSGVAF